MKSQGFSGSSDHQEGYPLQPNISIAYLSQSQAGPFQSSTLSLDELASHSICLKKLRGGLVETRVS